MQENTLTYEQLINLFERTDRKIELLTEENRKTEKQIKELGIQIGGVSNKFGTFTEGLVYPSIEKELYDTFKVTHVSQRAKNKTKQVEIDILGYSNGTKNEAYVVEVKSHLREEALDQILNILEHFKENFPEHKDKKVYGMIASIDTNDDVLAKIEKAGIYYANVANNIFELKTSKNFKPKVY
ncbi:MAG: DUF3782 domain-containing protein [Candidatus Kapabacteria bacterium]|nr:DUF3782 domain-containing protein [Candidatus Kapabacteria bacterium]